jgi:hypothetical protein
MYFHDSISADIDSLLLYAGVHAKVDGRRDPDRNAQTMRQRRLKNQ